MTNSGVQTIAEYRVDIEAGLSRLFAELPKVLNVDVSKHGELALERLEEFCLRSGKRLRGSLAALAYDSAKGTSHAAAGIQLGIALELMQAYLLIVDDVMDRSDTRRGEPALHKLYRDDTTHTHQADMIAINIGLLGQHLASMCVANINAPAEQLLQVSQLMQRNIAATAFGQLDDISTVFGDAVSEADIIQKYTLKSSYYTFVNPLQIGLALAGAASEKDLQACVAFGVPAGVAFQLHDDVLGVFGDSSQTGKQNLDDIREGKLTVLLQYAHSHGDAMAARQMKHIVGNPEATLDDLKAVQEILIYTKAKEYCEQLVREYADTAKASLVKHPVGTAELSGALSEIVEYAVTREL